MRGQTPLIVFNFFRFVMPFMLFAVALVYLYGITHFAWSPTMKLAAAVAAALAGLLSAGSVHLQPDLAAGRPPS